MFELILQAIRSAAGRLAAIVSAFLVALALDKLGLPLTADQAAGLTEWLTVGITGLGWVVVTVVYAVGHKIVDRFILPEDGTTSAG